MCRDKNSRKIYRGDTVKAQHPENDTIMTCIVKWFTGSHVVISDFNGLLHSKKPEVLEVIPEQF